MIIGCSEIYLDLRGTNKESSGEGDVMRIFMICIHQILFPGDQIMKIEMGKHAAPMGERRDAYRILVGRSEERVSLGRTRIYKR